MNAYEWISKKAQKTEHHLIITMDKASVNKATEGKEEVRKIEVLDDTNLDFISADSELTQDLPEDIEVIDLVHLKIKSLEDLNLLV